MDGMITCFFDITKNVWRAWIDGKSQTYKELPVWSMDKGRLPRSVLDQYLPV